MKNELEAAKRLIIEAAVGSCTCNTKSPEVVWHMPNCRYVTLMYALEQVEWAAEVPTKSHPAWQLIETAPRDETSILATGGGLDDSVQIVRYLEHVGAWETSEMTLDDRDDEADGYSRPTHWMSLPEGLALCSNPRNTQESDSEV